MRTKDGYLIQKCLNGDSAAFGFLVDKYRQSVYALAYAKLGDFHDAEDVTQEVFIKAYEKLQTLRRSDHFYAWLYAITSNTCKMWHRARANRPDHEFLADQDAEILDTPSIDAYHDKQVYQSLREALAELPEMYRQVLTLYYLGGMGSGEIAQFLGTSPSAINMRLSRARTLLKKEMLDMMTATFAQQRLQPGFTFRVVEMIKETKIQPAPRSTALPWGLSVTGILIAAFLSLTIPHSPLYPIGKLIGSALPSQTQVADGGVIPVDTVEITEITILSSESGEGDFGQKPKPEPIQMFGGGKWTKREDMPKAKATFPSVAVDGKIYAVGGWDRKALSTVEMYDPVEDRWTEKANMPTVRAFFAACAVDGKIYAMGGTPDDVRDLSTMVMYDPAKDKWTGKADMPTARSGLSASVVDGKIYAIGGSTGGKGVSTVAVYDPATDKWAEKAGMPTARRAFSASVVNEKIYAIGGAVNGNGPILSTVEVYDPATDTWEQKADMPTARQHLSAGVIDGTIYVMGGLPGAQIGFELSVVEAYDPATNTWEKKTDMPTIRSHFGTGAVDGRIYAIGGGAGPKLLSRVDEFDPEGVPDEEPQSVNPEGKLATTWAEVKAAR